MLEGSAVVVLNCNLIFLQVLVDVCQGSATALMMLHCSTRPMILFQLRPWLPITIALVSSYFPSGLAGGVHLSDVKTL
jgi:hypothetical protein